MGILHIIFISLTGRTPVLLMVIRICTDNSISLSSSWRQRKSHWTIHASTIISGQGISLVLNSSICFFLNYKGGKLFKRSFGLYHAYTLPLFIPAWIARISSKPARVKWALASNKACTRLNVGVI